jgi:hypothetical protein
MSSSGMKWVWVIVCLGLVGCSADKPRAQDGAGSKASGAKQAGSTAPSAAGQQTAPSASQAPKASSGTAGSTATVAPAPAQPATNPPAVEQAQEPKRPDVIFVPTPQEVVDKMLELAQVTKDDVVYDLGCGDGRIVVTAAKKYGCKAFGFDVDPERIQESKENVEKNGVGTLATIAQKDIFTLDLSKVNVVTLYLLPSLNVKLIPQLEKLPPGSRIVSHDFDMKGVTPDKVVTVDGDGGYGHTVYLWTTPLKKEAETK